MGWHVNRKSSYHLLSAECKHETLKSIAQTDFVDWFIRLGRIFLYSVEAFAPLNDSNVKIIQKVIRPLISNQIEEIASDNRNESTNSSNTKRADDLRWRSQYDGTL